MTLAGVAWMVSTAVDALRGRAGRHPEVISVVGALCLLGVYAVWLPRYLRERHEEGLEAPEPQSAGLSLPWAFGLLTVGGASAALASDWFVQALEPSLPTLHL